MLPTTTIVPGMAKLVTNGVDVRINGRSFANPCVTYA